MIFPLGLGRDPALERKRGQPLGHLVGSIVRPTPERVDLRSLAWRIPNQIGQSCGGHALAQCVRVRSAYEGPSLDPSGMALYALARHLDAPSSSGPLPDLGSRPNRMIEAAQNWGVVKRIRWPDSVDPTRRITADVLEAGATGLLTGAYYVDEEIDRRTRIRQALAQGHPVFWGREIDEAYQRLTGWRLYPGLTGPSLGGHAGCLVGYDDRGVYDAGSWGEFHGEFGFAHIAWDYVLSDHAWGFYVVTHAPLEVA